MSYKMSNFNSTYPIGDYEFEIEKIEKVKSGETESTKLSMQILSPTDLAGKKITQRVFESKLNQIVKGITGKSVPDHFKGQAEVSDEDVFKLIDGKFFKAKLGIKNGYNEIAQILEGKSNETPGSI